MSEEEYGEEEPEFEDLIAKYQTMADEITEAGFENVGEVMGDMIQQLINYNDNKERLIQNIMDKNNVIVDLTYQLGDVTDAEETASAKLRASSEENSNLKKEVDSAHLREQDYQELIESLRSQTEFLESEMDKVKKEQDDLATELGISGRTKEAFYKERDRLKVENVSLKSELSTLHHEKDETSHQLDQTRTGLSVAQQQLDELKQLNEELSRDKGYMSKEANLQRSLVHQLKKNLILLKSHHDIIRKELDDTKKNVEEKKTGLFNMQRVNKELRTAIRNDQKDISNLNGKVYDLIKSHEDYKRVCEERDRELQGMKKKVNDSERKERRALTKLKNLEICKNKAFRENAQLNELRKSTAVEFEGMMSKRHSSNKAYAKLQRDFLVVSGHLLKTTNLAADNLRRLEMEARQRHSVEMERDSMKNEVHRYFMLNLSLMSQNERCKQENTQLEQKIEEEILYIRHKERNIAELKKELEEKRMQIKKHITLYDEIKAERNVIARSLAETHVVNAEGKQHTKTMAKQLDQLKEQMVMKDGILLKAERTNKRKINEGVKLKWQLTKSRNQLKSCKETTAYIEKEQIITMRTLEKALKESNQVNKNLSKALNEKAVILTQLDRKTAELNCLQENVNFMDFILKKGDTQYNQRLDDIRILRLEVLKLRREKAMVIKALDNSADLRKEVYHLYADLNRERTKCTALEQEIQTPVNYHRWRLLQGTDPDQCDLIAKVQILQRDLIKSREDLTLKTFQVEELKATLNEFRGRMERMPGFDVYETISRLRLELSHKDDELKALSSVLACYEYELKKLKLNDKMMTKELEEFKKKYYGLKAIEDKKKFKKAEKPFTPYCKPISHIEEKPKKSTLNNPSVNISVIQITPYACS